MSEENGEQVPAIEANEPEPLTPGGMLKAARMRLGLSEDDVATELYMTAYRVRLIENNEFKKLNADAFVRGYLKSYALLVKLAPEQVLAAYAEHRATETVGTKTMPRKAPSQNKKILVLIAMVVAAFTLLWLVSVWFLDNRKAVEYKAPALSVVAVSSSAPAAVIADPADAIAVDTDEDDLAVNTLAQHANTSAAIAAPLLEALPNASQANVNAALTSTGVNAQVSSSAAAFPQASVVSAAATSAQASASQASSPDVNERRETAAAAAGFDQLRLEFSAECWLEVTDANGDVLASDLELAGSVREVQGRAPFQVKLGNANGVALFLNGYKVPIEPRAGTNVRSLRIGR